MPDEDETVSDELDLDAFEADTIEFGDDDGEEDAADSDE